MPASVISLPSDLSAVPAEHYSFVRRALVWQALLTGQIRQAHDCFLSAIAAVLAAAEIQKRALFQAGSLQWKCIPDHLDDGETPNMFAFMWEPEHPQSAPAVRWILHELTHAERNPAHRLRPGAHALPEVHCWTYWPEDQAHVDLTTGGLPDMRLRLLGQPWLAPPPPKYLIGTPPPKDAIYTGHRDATLLLFHLASLLLRDVSTEVSEQFKSHVLISAEHARRRP